MSEERTRILVVDDEPAMRAMAKAMLESMGIESVLANSGEQAIDLFHQSQMSDESSITMAIMDLTLPGGMSGVEALQELQEMDGDFPVVATSGYLEENAYEICQQIGFVGVLPKPYTAEKLRALIHWVVSRKGIPGGYSEGMPRPDPEPEKSARAQVEAKEAEGSPESAELPSRTSDETASGTEAAAGGAARSYADVPDQQRGAGSPYSPSGVAEGEIAGRLSKLVEIAVSHRGSE